MRRFRFFIYSMYGFLLPRACHGIPGCQPASQLAGGGILQIHNPYARVGASRLVYKVPHPFGYLTSLSREPSLFYSQRGYLQQELVASCIQCTRYSCKFSAAYFGFHSTELSRVTLPRSTLPVTRIR